jgi:DNA-binding response OmpR family regulator
VLPDDNSSGLADAVAYALRAEGFDVDAVADGEAALDCTLRTRSRPVSWIARRTRVAS